MHKLGRFRSEDGVAMILVLMSLFIVTMLAVGMVSSASHSSSTTIQQERRQVALAAAERGLSLAVHRISQQAYNAATAGEYLKQCFTTSFVAQPVSGNCPGQEEEKEGGRGSFVYYVSPEMGSSASCGGGACWTGHTTSSCTGYPVEASAFEISQRCVTSIGTYLGSKVRLQERIVDYYSSFPVAGIQSLSNILFDTNNSKRAYIGCPAAKVPQCPPVYLNGTFEANGEIKIEGEKKPNQDIINGTIYTGPSGKVVLEDPTYNCPAESLKWEFTGPPATKVSCTIVKGTQGFSWSAGAKLSDYTSSAVTNNNAAINTANPGLVPVPYQAEKAPCKAKCRVFLVTDKNSTEAKPVIIPSGIYNFCAFEVEKGWIEIPEGAHVIVYVDNSTTSDGCSVANPGDGYVEWGSHAGIINMNKDPSTFQVDVCGYVKSQTSVCGEWTGTAPCAGGGSCFEKQAKQEIGLMILNDDLNNNLGPEKNGMTYGEIYAPNSAITTKDETFEWTGGIVAGNFDSNDSDWIVGGSTVSNGTTLAFYPVAFHRCSTATGSDPTSGCY